MLPQDLLVGFLEFVPVVLLAGLAASVCRRQKPGLIASAWLAIALALMGLLALAAVLQNLFQLPEAALLRAILETGLGLQALVLALDATRRLKGQARGRTVTFLLAVVGFAVGGAAASVAPAVARTGPPLLFVAAILVVAVPVRRIGERLQLLAGLSLPLAALVTQRYVDETAFAYILALAGLLMTTHLSFSPATAKLHTARAAVIEAITDAVVTLDDDGDIIDVNAAARRRVDGRDREILGHQMSEVFAGWPILSEIAAEGAPLEREVELADENGALTYEVRSFAISATGASAGKCLVLRDITHQKQVEARMLHQETALAMLKERGRLGQEFHDGLAQDLVALRMKLCQWEDVDDPRVQASLPGLIELVGKDTREIRRAILALRPLPLAEAGFFHALRQHIDDFAAISNFRVELKVHGLIDTLPTHLEPAVFRVIQEALHNVAKHAQARSVKIVLDLRDTAEVRLTVSDDGVGFDPSKLESRENGGHLGLRQMYERVRLLRGSMLVRSELEQGTDLDVVLPRV